jgi:hypothetical protein
MEFRSDSRVTLQWKVATAGARGLLQNRPTPSTMRVESYLPGSTPFQLRLAQEPSATCRIAVSAPVGTAWRWAVVGVPAPLGLQPVSATLAVWTLVI